MKDLSRDDDGVVDAFELAEAPVAGVTGQARGVRLAEVLDQGAVAALRGGGVTLHLAKVLAVALAQLVVRLEQALPPQEIGRRRDEHAVGGQPVPSGAPRLLLVVLERPRRARMDHEPHVGPVDAHAERDRGDDDVGPLVDERLLVRVPRLVGHARVVGERPHAEPLKPGGNLVHLAAG